MSGSILGADQIQKLNSTYPFLLAHIRELLAKDQTPYGLMKVHVAVESIDSDVLHRTFTALSFLSPIEKKALVRAAVYEVLTTDPKALQATQVVVPAGTVINTDSLINISGNINTGSYTPPPFNLNVATAASLKEEHH